MGWSEERALLAWLLLGRSGSGLTRASASTPKQKGLFVLTLPPIATVRINEIAGRTCLLASFGSLRE